MFMKYCFLIVQWPAGSALFHRTEEWSEGLIRVPQSWDGDFLARATDSLRDAFVWIRKKMHILLTRHSAAPWHTAWKGHCRLNFSPHSPPWPSTFHALVGNGFFLGIAGPWSRVLLKVGKSSFPPTSLPGFSFLSFFPCYHLLSGYLIACLPPNLSWDPLPGKLLRDFLPFPCPTSSRLTSTKSPTS